MRVKVATGIASTFLSGLRMNKEDFYGENFKMLVENIKEELLIQRRDGSILLDGTA